MRRFAAAISIAGLTFCGAASDGAAEVVISVNKAKQTMSVLIDGKERYNWVVSTGVGGGPYDGTYRPGRMERKWASRKYGMAPMPYSIFFDGNYAIHGTVKVAQLGRRASKGCVRLHPRDAAVLFELVQKAKSSTTIVVSAHSHVAERGRAVAPPVVVAPKVVTPPKPAVATAEPPKPAPAAVAVKPATDGSGLAVSVTPVVQAQPVPEPEPAVTGSIPSPSAEPEFLE